MGIKELILFENDDFLIINKPAGISSLADRNDPSNMLELAKAYHPDAQLCHRLDKDTSGALVVAKNPEAYRHMSIQFEERLVHKVYHAVVTGITSFDNYEVDKPILKMSNGTARFSRKGKEAQTFFTTIENYKKHSLVSCRPVSGRMHQIRIHLASEKFPICMDPIYGGEPVYLSELKRNYTLRKGKMETSLIKRLALHAYSLFFNDLKGSKIDVIAPYPKDFAVLCKQLAKNS